MPPWWIKHDKAPSGLLFRWTNCDKVPSLRYKSFTTVRTLVLSPPHVYMWCPGPSNILGLPLHLTPLINTDFLLQNKTCVHNGHNVLLMCLT